MMFGFRTFKNVGVSGTMSYGIMIRSGS